jgi:hypothetical protein
VSNNSKVLVGIPSYPGDAHARIELVTALKNMRGNFDVYIVWNGAEKPWGLEDFTVVNYTPRPGASGHEILAAKENMIRNRALEYDYTHLLSLESDNMPKPDTLKVLLSHEQDIVSAAYMIRAQQEFALPLRDLPGALALGKSKGFDENTLCYFARNEVIPSIWGLYTTSIGLNPGSDHETIRRNLLPGSMTIRSRMWTLEDLIDAQQHRIIKIAGAGVGCVLISKKALKKVRFMSSPEFMQAHPEYDDVETHTDYLFYVEAKLQGFDSFLDPNHIVKHLHEGLADEKAKWFPAHEFHADEFASANKYEVMVA